ncbi:MAG: hypothetical protein CMC01_01115 [Flavobacteriaceae bacterium]|nr:hypothetical protein [Flavobacteriaceae bacterium]
MRLFLLSLFLIVFSCGKDESQEEDSIIADEFTIWRGTLLLFEKIDGSDPSDQSNQDRISENVWITRDNDGGQIYNIAEENSADKGKSPIGTMWAIGNLNEIENLNFESFRSAVGKPQDVVGKDLVMYLVEDDIYLSVKFKSWSQGQKGGFSYERSTP